jgi:hypothetical protein
VLAEPGPFQVFDRLVDRLDQRARPREAAAQHRPVRLQRRQLLEIRPADDVLDLPQPEPEFPVEQDLLQRQQLRLLVKSVPVRPVIRRLQQPGLVVEMQRPDADAGHLGHLFDGVRHRSSSSGLIIPASQPARILRYHVT